MCHYKHYKEGVGKYEYIGKQSKLDAERSQHVMSVDCPYDILC